jgi:hypothetical protein
MKRLSLTPTVALYHRYNYKRKYCVDIVDRLTRRLDVTGSDIAELYR